jgi:Domain of unknown function (DUF4062)
MKSVYISSTYADLIPHRAAVSQTIRRMNKIAVSMEDYTADDRRPLEKCLADLANCEIYVGLFALRYGFVPDHNNPDGLSITELEYKHARAMGKECLIFMARVDDWPTQLTDFFSGENGRGERILKLREQLDNDHTRILFSKPEELGGLVSTSVANYVERDQPRATNAGAGRAAATPLPREITADLFLAHSDLDKAFAEDLAVYLNSRNLRTVLHPRALFASSPDDFLQLEQSVRACHAAAILVSDPSLRQLKDRRKDATRIFSVLEARTENFLAICRTEECAAKMTQWPLGSVERVAGWNPREAGPPQILNERFESLRHSTGRGLGRQWVGLPVIVVAMTRQEADDMESNPALVGDGLGGDEVYQRFLDLRASIGAGGTGIADRYGERRLDCRPFASPDMDIGKLLKKIVERLNEYPPPGLRGRLMKLQNYQIDELISAKDQFSPIYTQLLSTGCVVIVDEYSVFHPKIQETILTSGLLANDQVSLVTLCPRNPYSSPPFDMLEAEVRRRMSLAFDRFASSFDPQCELCVGDENRLKRWLNASLPFAIQTLRDPKPNRFNISQFAIEQVIDPQPRIAPLLYTEGGPL